MGDSLWMGVRTVGQALACAKVHLLHHLHLQSLSPPTGRYECGAVHILTRKWVLSWARGSGPRAWWCRGLRAGAGQTACGWPAGPGSGSGVRPGATLALLGTFAQVNPVWLVGPSQPGSISAGSVPGWYMGFLDGALRIMPGWEISVFGHPLTLAVLVPGVLVPGAFFTVLAAYPLLDRRLTGDPAGGPRLDRPRDAAKRTAFGAAGITFYGLLWAAAANDETMYLPPAFSYRASRSGSAGQPSQATPAATPSSASRTASLA